MKAICASVNFDLFMSFPVRRLESHMPLNWDFPAIIGPENRKQVGTPSGGSAPQRAATDVAASDNTIGWALHSDCNNSSNWPHDVTYLRLNFLICRSTELVYEFGF